MSISNQGTAQAGYITKEIYKAFDVNKANGWNNLDKVILIRSACVLGVCLFVFILPDTSAV